MKSKKELVLEKYQVESEEELYDLLLKNEDNMIVNNKNNRTIQREQNKKSSKNPLKDFTNIFAISLIDILVLIGVGFFCSFALLLTPDNLIISVILMLLAALVYFVFKLKDISHLLLIPIPLILAPMDGFIVYVNIFVFAGVYIYLLKMNYKSSLHSLFLAIASIILVACNIHNEYILTLLAVVHILLFVFTWFISKKYITSSIYGIISIILIATMADEFNLTEGYLSILLWAIVFGVSIYFLFKTKLQNEENIFVKICHEIGLIAYFIALITYSCFLSYKVDAEVGLLLSTVIIALVILFKRNQEWLLYQFSVFNLTVLVPFYIIWVVDIDVSFITTIISLILFFGIMSYNKKVDIKKHYFTFYSFLYVVYIFGKISIVDLSAIPFIIRLFLLFILSIVFIGFAIFMAVKKLKNKKEEKTETVE